MTDETAAIRAAAQTYLDGLYEGDIEKLASVFHPTSALTWEEGGEIMILPRAQWLEAVRGRASSKARGLERHDQIVMIDQSSPTTALVKLKCQVPPRYFTDYLSFLKLDGRWQVAQKIFAVEVRN
jgi:Putative lumazine-binding